MIHDSFTYIELFHTPSVMKSKIIKEDERKETKKENDSACSIAANSITCVPIVPYMFISDQYQAKIYELHKEKTSLVISCFVFH